MRIAYLLLVHSQPTHVARLVRALRADGVRFFIHVDAKTDAKPFVDLIGTGDDVVWLGRRRAVYWYGFSTVLAELDLLRAAVSFGGGFQRYCLLSGADFPIKSNAQIAEVLSRNDVEFIRVDRALQGVVRDPHDQNIEKYFFNDWPWFSRDNAAVHWRLRKLCGWLAETVNRRLPVRRYPAPFRPWQGAQWWCLTHACVCHVLGMVSKHRSFVRLHRFVKVPDEVFFHTLIKASPYAQAITHDASRVLLPPYEHGCHYIDWLTPGVRLPKVLDDGDFSRLAGSSALFARKFDVGVSDRLLERVECELLYGRALSAEETQV